MLSALLRVRLLAIAGWLTGSGRRKKSQSKASMLGFAALMIYAFGCLGFLFWHMFETFAVPFHAAGVDWLFFALLFIMAFGLMFVGSVFTAKAQLFEAKDNDLLLSMPLTTGEILLSRMFMLLVLAVVFGLLVVVPAGIAWGGAVGFTAAGLIGYVIAFIMLVFLTLSICSLFGWILSLITARMRKKSLVTTVISLVFLAAYMYVCANMNSLITSLAAAPDAAAAAVGAVAPLYKVAAAVAAGDLVGVLIAALIVAVIAGATYFILSAFFMSAAAAHRGGKKVKYVERSLTEATPQTALFRRELGRFLSCSVYIINCSLGAIMTVAAAVILVIKADAVREMLVMLEGMEVVLPPLAIAAMCLLSSMTIISAPSISLEGRSIWIAQSLPVSTADIFRAKLRLHNMIAIPTVLIAAAAVAIVLKISGVMLAALIVLPVIFSVLTGILGLVENLRHPNLDWLNETQAVKSGLGVLFTMLIAWVLVALPVGAYILLSDIIGGTAVVIGFGVLFAAFAALLYRWLMRKGADIYMDL